MDSAIIEKGETGIATLFEGEVNFLLKRESKPGVR
jgi:hypothetical protein